MKILDGKLVSQKIKDSLLEKIVLRKREQKKIPHLAAVLIGSNGASETYVASKIKNCAEVGFTSSLIELDEDVDEATLVEAIQKLNADNDVDGILVQLPLPAQINEENIINLIDPAKDVDGFHPVNTGRMVQGSPAFIPATPHGIMLMLKYYNIETSGKHAVVIGRSNIVGRPMSILLSQNSDFGNCTVTLCHSRTKGLANICSQADIVVAALGKPGFLTAAMVKEGAVVIDVGITRVKDPSKKSGYAIKGDVDFENVSPKCSYITPVPGGVGLMTIGALLMNTYKACSQKIIDLTLVTDIDTALPVMESFYTLQGEGYHQGRAAYFIRLGGCDVGCVWCDVKDSWDASKHPLVPISDLVAAVKATPAKLVVITGGEPLMHDLTSLTAALKAAGLETNIETSGAHPLSGDWDWICFSPKKFKAPLPSIAPLASELKVVIFNKSDFEWAEQYAAQVNKNCKLYLQPEWDKAAIVTPMIIDYIKQHPQWELSLQIHKYINVP